MRRRRRRAGRVNRRQVVGERRSVPRRRLAGGRGSVPGEWTVRVRRRIAAVPEAVWAWIVQLGAHRAGFCTLEVLERQIGCGGELGRRIHPDWQRVAVGDVFALGPFTTLQVSAVQPQRRLALDSRGGHLPWKLRELADVELSWELTIEQVRQVPRGTDSAGASGTDSAGASVLEARAVLTANDQRARRRLPLLALAQRLLFTLMLRGIDQRAAGQRAAGSRSRSLPPGLLTG